MKHDKQVTLAITGASGAPYALTLLKSLVNADYQVYVLISSAAKVVFATEENVKIPGRPEDAAAFFTEHCGAKPDQIKVFGKGTHTMSETAAFNQPKAYAVNRLSPLLREFSTFDLGDIWETPLEFNEFATQRYKDLIPEPHDWLHIDPMKLLHTEDEDEREAQLIKIFDYLGFDYSIVDIGMLLCEKYMQDNKKLHKKRGFS